MKADPQVNTETNSNERELVSAIGKSIESDQSAVGFKRKPVMLLSVIVLLLVLTLATSLLVAHTETNLSKSQFRLNAAHEQLTLLDTYNDFFAELFPTQSNGQWIPADFPFVDWQDGVVAWLSSLSNLKSVYRWGEPIVFPVLGDEPLQLSLYPLWVDVEIWHESHLLQWLEGAWAVNPSGIENRGCQVSRIARGEGLKAQCLFALSTFGFSEPPVKSRDVHR